MSDIHIENLDFIHIQLIWFLPAVVAGLYVYAAIRRQAALGQFIDVGLLKRINISVSPVKRRWKAAFIIAAVAFIAIALTRPAWNPKPTTIERRGRDVFFILDVSKSMWAEDLAPNRLERAKLAIQDAVERLQGDRVGLIAFAGTAAIKCPLTLDYGFFRMMLDGITTQSIARGGTMIGDAIRKALDEGFDDQEKQYKDLILITDGEDHDSFPVEAAKQAGELGMRLIAIGLGDENEGKRIPITDQYGNKTYMKYDGQEVWSRLDADTLREMVNATPGGKYLNVSTGAIDLGNVYMKLIASAEKKDLESKSIKRYEEKFQIFLGIAFALLCFELFTNERKRRTA